MLEKYNEWDYTHPRLLWGGIFIGCFVVAFLIAIGITTTVQSLVISNESARSVISTSNQIQATILAIVISLTLLAVEMTASKYSPRVIEIFKNNVSMWVFIFSYIISITIGSIFLTFIDSPNVSLTTIGTLFLLVLGIFLILMLVPYVMSTLEFLNTERIIKRLANLINTKTINQQTDPFQSIFDLIYGAIKINDFTTMSTGLLSAEKRFKEIIAKDPANWQNDYISFRFFDDIKRCGFLLIEKREDDYAFEIVNRLNTLSLWAFREQNIIVLHRSCSSIEEIGIKACEYGLVSVVDRALTTLNEITESIENIEGFAHDERVTQKWSCLLFSSVESIGNIGKTTIKQDLTVSSGKAINILNNISRNALDKNLTFDDDFVFKRISAITIESINQDKSKLTNSFIEILQFLGECSVSQNRSKEAIWILDELKNIGISSAHQKKEKTIHRVVIAIRYIAIAAMRKDIREIRSKAIYNSAKLQADYPEFFKDRYKIQLLNSRDYYPYEDEDLANAIMIEEHELSDYLHPPDGYEG